RRRQRRRREHRDPGLGPDRPDRRRQDLHPRSAARHPHPHRRNRRGRAVMQSFGEKLTMRKTKTLHTKSLLGTALAASLLAAPPAWAQDAAAPVVEAAVEAAPAIDTGDTAWMFVSTMVVILMTIPGLALFYGGLVRSKNILSVLTQVMAGFCMIALLWVIYGYSLTFTGPTEGGFSAFIGGLGALGLGGITPDAVSGSIPELVFVCFQLTFAAI